MHSQNSMTDRLDTVRFERRYACANELGKLKDILGNLKRSMHLVGCSTRKPPPPPATPRTKLLHRL